MPKVIAVASEKGGGGKTTTVVNLAVYGVTKGHKCSIFDMDQQKSARKWADLRDAKSGKAAPAVACITCDDLKSAIERATSLGMDYVFIDTPPEIGKETIYAVSAADLVLLTTKVDLFDRFAFVDTLEFVKRVNAGSKCLAVINTHRKDAIDIDGIEAAALDAGIRTSREIIKHDDAFPIAMRDGLGVNEHDATKRKKAARQIATLFAQMQHMLPR